MPWFIRRALVYSCAAAARTFSSAYAQMPAVMLLKAHGLGDSYTVTAAGGGDVQISGGSLKFIADVAGWDHSLGLNAPGQSGDPRRPHYRDLCEPWSRGKRFPVFFTREKVASVTVERVTIEPVPERTSR